MIGSMRDLERTWNRKFNYPWTFFNDVEFTDDFKRAIRSETKAKVRFGKENHAYSDIAWEDIDPWLYRWDTPRTLGRPSMDK